ncbi:MAG: ABC transporter permease [Saccharofermentanales bacterium]|jgi:ABC-type uncharacterized transport system permease subunit
MLETVVNIINSTLRMTTPIAFVGLGAVLSEKAGINALAMEGIMLMGSFGAVLGSYLTNSAWVGVLCGMLWSAAMSLTRGILSINLNANQTLTGVGTNIMASGLTALLIRIIWGVDGKSAPVNSLSAVKLPLISEIPVIGPIVGYQNPLVLLLFPCLIGLWFLLSKTKFGLRVTVAGEKPEVLGSLGINVAKYRYLALLLSGLVSGLGGAYLSLGQLSFFISDMTSGRGYMALAACIFGGWAPVGTFFGSLLFGFAETIQTRLQSVSTFAEYSQFVQMIPYVLTVIVLAGMVRKQISPPSALGKPYEEQV